MKINISEYYESILSDPMITVVLAWIEKSGKITEFEIIKEIGIDENILKNIVIKLYRNNLIDISNDCLTVTDNGKVIIDALNLTDDIISNSYVNLVFQTKEKQFINESIHWYRENHYGQYLNTFNSLKYWNRFRSKVSDNEESNTKKSISYLLILFHDMIYVNGYLEQKNFTFDSLLSHTSENHHGTSETDLKYSRAAYSLFIDFVNIKSKEELNQYATSEKELFVFLKCKDYLLNNVITQKKLNKYLHAEISSQTSDLNSLFWNYTSQFLKTDNIYPKKKENAYISDLKPKMNTTTILDELVFIIENSNSLTDISISLRKSEEDTEAMLLRLKKGVKNLTKKK